MRLYIMVTLGVSVTLSHFCCSNIGCICQILWQLLGNIGCYLYSVKRKVSLKGWRCSYCVEPAWPKSLAREKTAYLKSDILSCSGSAMLPWLKHFIESVSFRIKNTFPHGEWNCCLGNNKKKGNSSQNKQKRSLITWMARKESRVTSPV